jgi:putative tryptophan/tyrosine transport system substrate-binding protein
MAISIGAIDVRRRRLLAGLGGAAACAAFPLAVRAQDPVRIGVLNSISYGPIVDRIDAMLDRIEDAGFVDGQNLSIEYLSAEGRAERLPLLAAQLAQLNVQVIICLTGASTVRAAMQATSTIPIVFAISGDPFELGLVANAKHPEGNVTGASRRTEELNPERLKVISEMVSASKPIAFLINSDLAPAATTNERIEQMETTATALGRQLVVIDLAGREKALPAVFAAMAQQDIAAFVISTEALFSVFRDQVIGLSARHNIAAIFPNREYPHSGGLISFGADIYEHYRIAGDYVGRILKGEKPAGLPVQDATKFELVLNLKTAQALGLTVPPSIRALASEVIE